VIVVIEDVKLFVYPVKDLERAKAMYTAVLGVEPYADMPYYVGFRVGDVEIGLDPNGHAQGFTGPIEYWRVADLDAALERFRSAGAEVHQDAQQVGPGRRRASVRDADGNITGLLEDS
jgi:predicted enzyme related to lactoylglutathione lyase